MHREHFESSEGAMEYLKEFITEYNTQDNKATASPYFFVIRDYESITEEEDDDDEEEDDNRSRAQIVTKQRNVFFTQKAIDQHMKDNHYHYSDKAYAYLDCAWRNPELEKMLEAIGKVCGVEYERK